MARVAHIAARTTARIRHRHSDNAIDCSTHVPVQAIEFWSTLAEMELMYREEDEEGGVTSGEVGADCQAFLDRCVNELVPLLLELLLLQSEDQDNDDTDWRAPAWTRASHVPAIRRCLSIPRLFTLAPRPHEC
jgi:hypothetical protein